MEFINLTSNRLLLRPFSRDDRFDLFEYLSKEECVKFEPYGVQSLDECTHMALVRERNPDFIAVCLGDKMIGNLFFRQQSENRAHFELGYVFNSEYWGLGFALESCRCLLNFAFCEMGAKKIQAYCCTENIKSWELLECLGMKRSRAPCESAFFKFSESQEPRWLSSYEYTLKKRHFGRLAWK